MVDQCLSSTFAIHKEIAAIVQSALEENADQVCVPVKSLKRWKTLANKSNKSMKLHALNSFHMEDRRQLEAHILRAALRFDCLDREASQAKVYDRFRHLSDSSLANAMDRSLSGAAQVEEMLSMLSPTGKVNFFGAARLASAASAGNSALSSVPCAGANASAPASASLALRMSRA